LSFLAFSNYFKQLIKKEQPKAAIWKVDSLHK